MEEHEHLIRDGIQGEADMDKREPFWGPTPITGYLLLWMCQRKHDFNLGNIPVNNNI